MNSSKPRVRFAPSPTGFLHVGGLRTALYNFLFAKKYDGTFLLRIEDTDQARTVPGGKENIIRTLAFMGLIADEKPIIQSERLTIYQEHAKKLIERGNAYFCFCTTERLKELRENQQAKKLPTRYDGACRGLPKTEVLQRLEGQIPSVIRLKVPESGEVTFLDAIYGIITVVVKEIDDQVLLKSDGFPTYHLASVVDDHLMQISHVIRGDDWLPSTPKHVLLYQAFDWEIPEFAHLPLLLNPDHSKLSKRQADVAVEDYLNQGYLPEALLNFITLLGWHPAGDKEIFSLTEMIKEFSLDRVQKSGAVFDLKKLDWMNGLYLRALSPSELFKRAEPFLKNANLPLQQFSHEQIEAMLTLEQERLKKLSTVGEGIEFYFSLTNYPAELLIWKKTDHKITQAHVSELASFLSGLPDAAWTSASLETRIKAFISERGWTIGECLWPMRVALSGLEASPGPFDIANILGKTETVERLKLAAKKLS